MLQWVWQYKNWPNFYWDEARLAASLASARLVQGRLQGIVECINSEASVQLEAQSLALQMIDTSAIEGERLNRDSVRSSIARRLGISQAGLNQPADRYIDGLLEMLIDATSHYAEPLTLARLCGWQASLFPTGYSGICKILVGSLRDEGEMKIISGLPGKEKLHYLAPSSEGLANDLRLFLDWFNRVDQIDGLIKAGVSHLWFELLHPFDDGNGRVGRAIIDLALAKDEQQAVRYYCISSAMMQDRKQYYASLEQASRGDLDITAWLLWFISCFKSAVNNTIKLVEEINAKSKFWERHAKTLLNERQVKALNRMLDAGQVGFEGGMTTKKYSHLTRTSRATAYRELHDLVSKGCLRPLSAKGRASGYEVCWF